MDNNEIVVERGCGLDVHKKSASACIDGKGLKKGKSSVNGVD